jgi:alpha-glucosidase
MTNWEKRALILPLDFLGKGQYQMSYWADGDETGKDAESLSVGVEDISSQSHITLTLSPGGGYVAIIEAKDNE